MAILLREKPILTGKSKENFLTLEQKNRQMLNNLVREKLEKKDRHISGHHSITSKR